MANGECSCHLRAMWVPVITVTGRPVIIASFWVTLPLGEYRVTCPMVHLIFRLRVQFVLVIIALVLDAIVLSFSRFKRDLYI
jgi:hypothetical protein